MNFFKKMLGSALACLVVLAALSTALYFPTGRVHAVAGDTTSTFFGNATTVGTVITGTTGKRLVIKEIIVTSASSGTVVFQEDPSTGSNTTFGQVGLLANEPFHVPTSMLQISSSSTGQNGGDGYVTAAGSGFQVINQNAASAVVSVWVRYALN